MCKRSIIALAVLAGAAMLPAGAESAPDPMLPGLLSRPMHLAQGARTCRDVSSCREAVILWCGGYRRADGDGDGIPCENVCRSRSQVEAIQEEIGC